jgi:aryl-alcohol dehydrogenase-like predicted oxidoreductase
MEHRRLGHGALPIPGTKRVDRLEENVCSVRVRRHTDDLPRIDEAMPRAPGQARYPDPR